jgi:hypothetical protein
MRLLAKKRNNFHPTNSKEMNAAKRKTYTKGMFAFASTDESIFQRKREKILCELSYVQTFYLLYVFSFFRFIFFISFAHTSFSGKT